MSRKHRLAGLHKRMELLVSRIKADDAELTKLRREAGFLAMPESQQNMLLVESLMSVSSTPRAPVVR